MTTLPSWPPMNPSVRDDAVAMRKDMEEYAERLFVKDSPVDVEIALVNENGFKATRLYTGSDVSRYFEETLLEESKDDKINSLYCLLSPGYGWSQLLITRDGMLSILSSLNIFPAFYRYLRVFGLEDFPKDEGFGGFDLLPKINKQGTLHSLELCYLIKHVELREGSQSGKNPWSLRHTVIYQKVCPEEQSDSHVLVRLSGEMNRRLGQSITGNKESALEFGHDWTQVHNLCWNSIDDGWRKYINYLDEEVYKIYTRVVIAAVDPTKFREIDTTESSSKDMKMLQVLTDQALRMAHMIDVNLQTLKCISETLETLNCRHSTSSLQTPIPKFQETLAKTQQEHQFHHRNVSSLITRATILSGQLRDTVALRNSELNRLNTELNNKNTVALLELSDQASQETHVVKSLTILALIFVPASFSADFLQMGYISVIQGTKFTLAATPDLQIYALLAIPLVAITMFIYAFVEISKQRALNRRIAARRKHSV